MTTFNSEDTVERAVRSVLNQSQGDFELLISDACSTDSTLKILSRLADGDSRIRLILSTEQQPCVVLTKNALRSARGRYFAIVDGDDFVATSYLENLLVRLEGGNWIAAMACLVHCDLEGKHVPDHPSSCRNFFFSEIGNRWLRLTRLVLTPDCYGACNLLYALWSIDSLREIGFWSVKDERPDDDQLFVLRAVSLGPIAQVPTTWICRTIPTARGVSVITSRMGVEDLQCSRPFTIANWDFPLFVQLRRFASEDPRRWLIAPAIFVRLVMAVLAVPKKILRLFHSK